MDSHANGFRNELDARRLGVATSPTRWFSKLLSSLARGGRKKKFEARAEGKKNNNNKNTRAVKT